MHYFLIHPNNELQHLPHFCLIPREEAQAADGVSNGKKRMQFVCPHHSAELPLSFLVADENATVRVCSGRMLQSGEADFVLTGLVIDEYEAPHRQRALNGIQAAVAGIPK